MNITLPNAVRFVPLSSILTHTKNLGLESIDSNFFVTKKSCNFDLQSLGTPLFSDTALFNRSLTSFEDLESRFKLVSEIAFKLLSAILLDPDNSGRTQLISKAFYHVVQNFDLIYQIYSPNTLPKYRSYSPNTLSKYLSYSLHILPKHHSTFRPDPKSLPAFSSGLQDKFTLNLPLTLQITNIIELYKFQELFQELLIHKENPKFVILNDEYVALDLLLPVIECLNLEAFTIDDTNSETINLLLNTIFKNINSFPSLTTISIGEISKTGFLHLSDLPDTLTFNKFRNFTVKDIQYEHTLKISRTLNSLGMIYKVIGGKKNIYLALIYWTISLEIRKKLLPRDHVDAVQSLNNLGAGYYTLGKEENFIRANYYWMEAKGMMSRLHIDLDNITPLLNNLGKNPFALKEEEQVKLENSGLWKSSIQQLLNNLEEGDSPLQKEDILKASELWTAYIQQLLDNLGKGHFALQKEKDIERALEYWAESFALKKKDFPDPHPSHIQSLIYLAQGHYALGKEDDAVTYWESALIMHQELSLEDQTYLIEPLYQFAIKNEQRSLEFMPDNPKFP